MSFKMSDLLLHMHHDVIPPASMLSQRRELAGVHELHVSCSLHQMPASPRAESNQTKYRGGICLQAVLQSPSLLQLHKPARPVQQLPTWKTAMAALTTNDSGFLGAFYFSFTTETNTAWTITSPPKQDLHRLPLNESDLPPLGSERWLRFAVTGNIKKQQLCCLEDPRHSRKTS